MRLPGAGHNICHALRHHSRRFIPVLLVDKTAARIEISPHVAPALPPDFPFPGNYRFRIRHFRHTEPPRHTVERAQVIRKQRCGCAVTGIPRNTAADKGGCRMTDSIRIKKSAGRFLRFASNFCSLFPPPGRYPAQHAGHGIFNPAGRPADQ
ncbi:Uncharacterised protein [Proteus mirabilis]|uniref:Uncharacterized protein n=1 Tax=Proteus mirabilis TaxID=584 RepID=A0A2X2CAE6_PROMI|nr:Uncharacterised protein [Proteus mirabilis]